jgi:hypothetical protein
MGPHGRAVLCSPAGSATELVLLRDGRIDPLRIRVGDEDDEHAKFNR